ncbi:MAG: transport permease protein [Deltaproteobacteria bacterium]|jgi:ABC-2 type transport system permease protein|nr:MAG: transport permease protein [Deltaproteobacteria bacterium]
MALFIEKPLAFVWRDFINETSYKFSFLLQFFGIFISTLIFFFLSKLLGDTGASYLKPYGGNYFSFVLIGIAFYSYLGISIHSISKSIREGQMFGTLEALLVTQTGIPTIIISSSLYSFIWASFRVAVYLLLGSLVFGVNMGNANLVGALLILILTILSFGSLGIISASFIMIFKRGDPVSRFFTGISTLLGGLYYPVSVLPEWLQNLSYLLPITYSLEGMRLALLKGYSLSMLMPNIAPLVIFSVIMLPISIMAFGYAIKRAKIEGTLTHY